MGHRGARVAAGGACWAEVCAWSAYVTVMVPPMAKTVQYGSCGMGIGQHGVRGL